MTDQPFDDPIRAEVETAKGEVECALPIVPAMRGVADGSTYHICPGTIAAYDKDREFLHGRVQRSAQLQPLTSTAYQLRDVDLPELLEEPLEDPCPQHSTLPIGIGPVRPPQAPGAAQVIGSSFVHLSISFDLQAAISWLREFMSIGRE
jgi:hypothetical protein